MSATTLVSPLGPGSKELPAQRGRAAWIISPRQDLTWFIGSAAAGYAAVAVMWAGFPLLPLLVIWLFVVDGPHVVATVTRTYFDKAERKKLGWFLWIPVPLMLVGPAMALAGQAALFFLLAFCWQQFHVVKQHFGFVMLYKAKNRERDATDRTLDHWFLLASLFAPLGLFLLRTHPVAALNRLPVVIVTAYCGLAAAWLGRQAWKLRTRAIMNWPKLGLMAAVVPLQWIALSFAVRFGPAGTMQAAIPLGLFHGLQYHRLLWFHNRNRYSAPEARERNGLAALVASKVWIYLAAAIGLQLLLTFLPQTLFPSQAVAAAVWGVAFTHYCMDARIWHVRGDKELAAALKMS